jgi:N6-adenosine-specific RNA methylase IME4
MYKKFQIVIADPPWFFFDGLKMSDTPRGAADNYALMSNDDIKKIPVSSVADPDGAILALWVPSSLLKEGLEVMDAWGFKHKQTYIWVKTKKDALSYLKNKIKKSIKSLNLKNLNAASLKDFILSESDNFDLSQTLAFGMGHLFRQTHEICLIGINNNKIYKKLNNKSQRSVSFGENLKHSVKPEHLHNALELMFPDTNINKIELFARRQRLGWLCVGNESPMTKGEDIKLSLDKLISASEEEMDAFNQKIFYYDLTKDKELFEMWGSISSKKI